ncbi:precorrin-2 C20-methyltransferase / precorrin-3B C17-methyltransferase [Austwickia chelonae]|uniref:Precorrin-2 C(20)-methyltransferase/precorrin-3B C(17)-methyltransferase n=1 Tax=Austwickia chelonae NBRC 105200 TaxID=1184607 RepID=K6UM84_9MICO|nr:precorrin-2 C(20)-methyltransferase [Austwickia chelonae]GAB77891.1 precorrin-2 C(20)-methyltransferase/precorrin-3B C(17)-methyltransferase [Austwickia chelonae NBRC 105200]SEV91631.1 precorrin-2 C20-methyltransferase / precorrin-3B C17-methyltransferase [Austwickia chelonae]
MNAVAPGRLWGVGVGPGDPELVTVKAARIITAADVVAYHSGPSGRSGARAIADAYLREGQIEELMMYPVTTGTTDHPGGYYGAIEDFYDTWAARLAEHLAAGRDVVVLAEGDPMFYGSYMYLHDRLADRFTAQVVPGVTSVAGSTAAVATGLCRHEDVLTVLPGTLPVPELARRLADTDAAVVMKLGRTFPGVVEALRQAGRLDDAWYVEFATRDAQRVLPVSAVDPAEVPYMAMVVMVGHDVRADAAGRAAEQLALAAAGRPPVDQGPAELLVVGLGPGPDRWLTPEVSAALAEVSHVVGYAPYVDRVPQRVGLTRHASGNTVEVDRARLALDLALAGERVAVVSGGDAGVFGMASAVFEAAEGTAADGTPYSRVPVRVLPGVTAAQAVAARAGAPLGGDYAVISLSDRLKPWAVVEERLRAVSRADLVVAIYNPASRTRTEQIVRAHEVLSAERGADCVVVVGRDVGRAEESLTVTTLGALDPRSIDMKCLLVVGARGTVVDAAGRAWTKRFVPAPVAGTSTSLLETD